MLRVVALWMFFGIMIFRIVGMPDITVNVVDDASSICHNANQAIGGCAFVGNNTLVASRNGNLERIIVHEIAHIILWNGNRGLGHDSYFMERYKELTEVG